MSYVLLAIAVRLCAVSHGVDTTIVSPVPPGQHPRVLFTAADLPAIRTRAKTRMGQRQVQALEAIAKRWVRDFDKAFPIDEAAQAEACKPGGARDDVVERIRKGKFPYFADVPYRTALLAQITDDPQHRRWAANYLRGWLLALLPADGLRESEAWGHPRLALAYDLALRDLSEPERQLARDLVSAHGLSATMQGRLRKCWYVWGPNRANGSHSNWDCIYASNTLVSMMAIEGESCRFTVAPDAFDNSVKVLSSFLQDGITRSGAFFDGTGYPQGYGTHFTPHALIGLRVRGVDAVTGTNAMRPGFWLTYEMLPWGGESQAMNKSGGDYHPHNMFPTWLAVEGDEYARWYYASSCGGHGDRPFMSAEIALINGIPEATSDWTPERLPLHHWFSVIGKVISRGGWGAKDSHFAVSANPISTGHSHADNGQFCFADQGVNFFVDSAHSHYTSDEHNLVLIDGKGQARVEGSVEGFIRYAELTDYADVADLDLEESYTRFISGPLDGPWHFESYNPVEWADRRTLFVRGATGTIMAVADDVQKDENQRNYQWRVHSSSGNRIETGTRGFTISERFGGAFLESVGAGQECTLAMDRVPAGRYRCWALVRGLPRFPRYWSNTTGAINGKKVLYNSTYFALGSFGRGWYWNEIRMGGRGADPWMDLPAGRLEVKLTGSTGSQVALFLFSTREDWAPDFGFALQSEPGVVVLAANDVTQGEPPWAECRDPVAQLEGIFLGRDVPTLTTERSTRSKLPRVLADKRTRRWRSVCVAAAYELEAPRKPEVLGHSCVRYSQDGDIDYVAAGDGGQLAGEVLETDGEVASAALPEGTLAAYALVHGTNLRYDGRDLVRADVPVTVICDGRKLVIRGPSGATVRCAPLTATAARANGEAPRLPQGNMPEIRIPTLPKDWGIETSPDGRVVTVTGDGPWPLKIHAPKARELYVNGVQRHFIRSERAKGEGWIWPYLESMACWRYAGDVGADTLASWVRSGDTRKERLPNSTEEALLIDRGAELRVPLTGPAEYELMLRVYAAEDTEVLLRAGDVPKAWTLRGGRTSSKTFTGFHFTGNTADLLLLGTAPVFLRGVVMKPQLTLLPPELWSIIGPFAAGPQTPDGIRKAMATPFIPETATVDFSATHEGEGNRTLTWQQGKTLADANDYKRSMWSKQLGFKNQGISYSVTHINSPTDRDAELGIMVDYWANVWLNGQPVVSERSRRHVERDGCEFNDTLTRAKIHLVKGRNVLLVKVRGGNGSNAFSGYITNPGDLVIAPR